MEGDACYTSEVGHGRERHLAHRRPNRVCLGAGEQAYRYKSLQGRSIAVAAETQQLREREFNENEWRTILDASLAPPPHTHGPTQRDGASVGAVVVRLYGLASGRDHAVAGSRCPAARRAVGHPHHSGGGCRQGSQARVVPLHEHLLELGFVKFAQAKGQGPLFYDPADRRGEAFDPLKPVRPPWVKSREKLAEWVRSLGVTDPNISPNHAWRHTFKRRAARAGVERNVRDAICGHKLRDVGDKYEAPTVEDMAVALRKFPRYALSPPLEQSGTAPPTVMGNMSVSDPLVVT